MYKLFLISYFQDTAPIQRLAFGKFIFIWSFLWPISITDIQSIYRYNLIIKKVLNGTFYLWRGGQIEYGIYGLKLL